MKLHLGLNLKLALMIAFFNISIASGFTTGTNPTATNVTPNTNINAPNPDDGSFNSYYTIDDANSGSRQISRFQSPMEFASIQRARLLIATLLNWQEHDQAPQQPVEPYNRLQHFGAWVGDPTHASCHNTRARALIRDSRKPVQFSESNNCTVKSGEWLDPYTGDIVTDAQQLQIDHVVPLKDAYRVGAFKWNYQQRCAYANFMANNYHLLSVSGHENMSKGDKSPDGYIPPNPRVQCGYLEAWLKIKLIWGLIVLPPEAQAISQLIDHLGCDRNSFSMDTRDLQIQRSAIYSYMQNCPSR